MFYIQSPRNEKSRRTTTQNGVRTFCPKVSVVKQWVTVKKSKSTADSFLCFVKIKEQERDLVFSVSGVVRYLFSRKARYNKGK